MSTANADSSPRNPMSATKIKELFNAAHEEKHEEEALQHMAELTVAFPSVQLNVREQKILEYTIKKLTSDVRTPLREALNENRTEVTENLKTRLRSLIDRIEMVVKVLDANVSSEDPKSQTLYRRVRADLERYRIDVSINPQASVIALQNANRLYLEAKRYSRDMDPSDLVCLQLALNYSAFQMDYLRDIKAAYRTVREAREDAIQGGENSDPQTVYTIESLLYNMQSWQSAYGKEERVDSDDSEGSDDSSDLEDD